MDKEIRTQIRQAMSQQGLSQVELAKRLGVTPPALSQLLTGKRGTMPESLMNVLEALGLELVAQPKQDG